ncbi:hypothetical protein PCH_Pc12g14650 [Penicillium rubens Wisconsin 54-1255]|uniref:Uncharacterized protein n=1 Tax=Penicillium rubens (strain ATCC 28089 / DSM 1075 / NRRL 1951 / Wisconsin 54-1255) TaxID=500485 RepID=B6H135_PENRW|nr:hypothetical protein PCH_Pc12g14650 [Penicillium rubens Wisconsin 54-1255]
MGSTSLVGRNLPAYFMPMGVLKAHWTSATVRFCGHPAVHIVVLTGTRKWDLLNRMMSTGISDLGVTSERKAVFSSDKRTIARIEYVLYNTYGYRNGGLSSLSGLGQEQVSSHSRKPTGCTWQSGNNVASQYKDGKDFILYGPIRAALFWSSARYCSTGLRRAGWTDPLPHLGTSRHTGVTGHLQGVKGETNPHAINVELLTGGQTGTWIPSTIRVKSLSQEQGSRIDSVDIGFESRAKGKGSTEASRGGILRSLGILHV